MGGETDISTLLATVQPILIEPAFVFCPVSHSACDSLSFKPLGTFREKEGITLIITDGQARHAGLPYDSTSAGITLTVHSSLSAVGFLAAITTRLAQAGISINAISASYHDHLFCLGEAEKKPWMNLKN